ncbi:MAG: enoyl-CoA hydratase-related protein [Actinomycetes bacterium]
MTETVRLEVADGVATVRLSRPDELNALDLATKLDLLQALRGVADDPGVRAVVLTGSGRAFCVGQDLREHAANLAGQDLDRVWATVPEHYNPIATTLAGMAKPVVAAVNGIAAGAGASLAFLADYRLVAQSAGFNLAFAGVGLSCDTGSSWTLPRLVGPTRAMALLLQPRTVPATEALDIGLASEVVADADFEARTRELAGSLASGPTLAYAALRRAVAYSASHTLAESLELEAELMRTTGSSADHADAVRAFLARRPPVFAGR